MSAAPWELAAQMILIEVGPMMGFNSGFDISDEEDSDYCPPGGHLQTRVQGASSERWHHLGHFRTCSVTEGRARKWYHRMPKFGQRGGGWKVDIIHTCSGWHQPFGYVPKQWRAHSGPGPSPIFGQRGMMNSTRWRTLNEWCAFPFISVGKMIWNTTVLRYLHVHRINEARISRHHCNLKRYTFDKKNWKLKSNQSI